MSKTRYPWWGYVKAIIRNYPMMVERYYGLREQSVTANYNGMPKGGSASHGVEDLAVRELPRAQQREYESVRLAIDQTMRLQNGRNRMRVIQLVFWARSHTLEGAALEVHCSERTARRWHTDFILLVAQKRGLLD